MTTEESLLWSIRLSPDEDAPRLIYADWLEENGDPERAEFLRVQIEEASLDFYSNYAKRLRKRANEILDKNRRKWLGSVPGDVKLLKNPFERGLVTSVSELNVLKWAKHSRKLLKLFPALHRVKLSFGMTGKDEGLKVLEKCKELESITDLDLGWVHLGALGPNSKHVRHFVAFPQIVNCRRLELVSNWLLPEGMQVVAAAPTLRNLTYLGVGHNFIKDKGLEALASSQNFPELRSLNLAGNEFTAEGVAAFAQSPLLSQLRSLHMGLHTEEAITELFQSPHLGNLQELGLAGDADVRSIGDESLVALLNAQSLGRLHRVNLSRNRFTEKSVQELAKSSKMAELRSLDLSENDYNLDAGLVALAESKHMANLETLLLTGVQITHVGVKALAESPHFANLKELDLRDNHITDIGAESLAESPYLQHVRTLNLKENGITEIGAKKLKKRFQSRVKV